MSTYSDLKAQYDKTFAQHRLERVMDYDSFIAYKLTPPEGGRLNSVMIMFTPEGIVIAGDHAPGNNGVVSDYGNDRAWFSSANDPAYLAQKFKIEHNFQCALAEDYVRDRIKELRAEDATTETMEPWLELLENLQLGMSHSDFIDSLRELKEDEYWNVGIGYDPRTLANLTAIRHRFAVCMRGGALDVKKAEEA